MFGTAFMCQAVTCALLWQGSGSSAEPYVSSRIEDRVVRSFDFDEQPLGNYESMPMHWSRVNEIGYHRFLVAAFDESVGHQSPPSFRFGDDALGLAGGNIGAFYLAKDIPVHPNASYEISAWVKPSGLVHAHAYITAYYLDHALRMIESSERHSEFVRGAGTDEAWQKITVQLPGGFKNARWIGLSCRVEQSPENETSGSAGQLRPIDYRDVHANAWFDDIAVVRLPQASIRLNALGNVYFAEDPIECLARVADLDGSGLDVELEIVDAVGRVTHSYAVPTVQLDAGMAPIEIVDLKPGYYIARLAIHVDEYKIREISQPFIRLGPVTGEDRRGRAGFGVIVDPGHGTDHAIIENLVRILGPDTIKFPLWRSDMTDEDVVRGDKTVDGMLHGLQNSGVTLVGTLNEPPASLAAQYGPLNNTLLDVLSSDPNRWRAYTALVFTRYGLRVHAWQVGSDAGFDAPNEERLIPAMANVRAELESLVSTPRLVAPRSIFETPPPAVASNPDFADTISLAVPAHVSPLQLRSYLQDENLPEGVRRWVSLTLLDSDRYDRRTYLVSLAQRIIMARHSGADVVFIKQPWLIERSDDEWIPRPTEAYLILDTIIRNLGGLEPLTPIWLDHGVHAWLFGDEATDEGVIVAWTEGDPDKPRRVTADIAPAARLIDMWGRAKALSHTGDGLTFELDSMPVILSPVSVQRAQMLAQFKLDDPTLPVSLAGSRRTLTLANTSGMDMRGTLHLEGPVGWQIQPSKLPFDLKAGETGELPIRIRVPNNQAVGDYQLLGRIKTDEVESRTLTLRAPVKIDSPGLDVNVMTRLEGDSLRVVQRITNLTEQAVSLRVFMIAPDRSRNGGIIAGLRPGETEIREYQIDNAAGMSGRYLRVGVEQIGGSLRDNQVILFKE